MKRHDVRERGRLKALLLVLLLAAALVLAYQGGRWLETRNTKPEARGDHLQRYDYEDTIAMDGVSYRRKKNITSILLMGIDRDSDAVVTGYRNGGQADFLQLLVIDSAEKTITRIQIDRDTMTPITILGVLGNQSGVRTAQICLSHGFGDGEKQSCELTASAVSNLLLGAPVDDYVAMNLDGISVLNDWAGGVTVTLEDDFSALDASMTPGTTLTLMGDQAEIFVRSRMNIGVGTNEARMKRQQTYLAQLTAQLDGRLRERQSAIGDLYDVMEPYIMTDMSRGRLINEVWAGRDYERMATLEIEGVHQVGADGFMQMIPDEASIQDMTLRLFYEEVK